LVLAGVLASLGFGIPFGVFPGAVAFGNTPPFAKLGLVMGTVLGVGVAVWRVLKRRVFWALPAVAVGASCGAVFGYFVGGLLVGLVVMQIRLALQP
jgi:hypothetical protein